MKEKSAFSRRLRKFALIAVLLLAGIAIALGVLHRQPWAVPAAQKEIRNPLTVSEDNLNAARRIYDDKCSNCHGDKGKGDGSDAMMYDPAPADLTDAAKMSKKTDGELFYQITEGRKPMPSYKKKLTDEQRWQMVLFVRSLAGSRGPSTPPQK